MIGQTTSEQAWRCKCCGSILGVRQSGRRIQLRHKEHVVTVGGAAEVTVPCRRCKTENTATTHAA